VQHEHERVRVARLEAEPAAAEPPRLADVEPVLVEQRAARRIALHAYPRAAGLRADDETDRLARRATMRRRRGRRRFLLLRAQAVDRLLVGAAPLPRRDHERRHERDPE